MGTNLSLTDIAPVLEELYFKDNTLEDLMMRENPLLAMLPKSEQGGGEYRVVPMRYVLAQGRSATFANAQTYSLGSQRKQFQLTWVSNYQVAGIDGNVIDDAAGNKTLVIDHIKSETDAALANMTDDIASNVFRNHGGARGQVASISTVTVTLSNPEDVVNFEVGMEVQGDTTDGTSGSVHSGSATITAIDRDAGTLTTDSNWTSQISSLAANDYLFAYGDFGLKARGLASWLPSTAPTSGDSFLGVDRSVDPVRLAGVRYTGTGMSLETAIVQGCARVRRWKKNGRINLAVLNPLNWAKLAISLEGKRISTVKSQDTKGVFSFDAIMVATPTGDVPVISDPNCQASVCWLLNTDTWCVESVNGPLVRLLDEDGLPFLRQATSDGYELRVKSRWNMYTTDPGANARVAI
jgi:hypothetical protein